MTKWRLYDPVFQAALNQRRNEVWGAGVDRIRALLPKALDVLAADLDNLESPNRFKAACEIIRQAQIQPDAFKIGQTDPDAIVRRIVEAKRSEAHNPVLDAMLNVNKELPTFDEHIEQVRMELERLAGIT